MYYTTKVEVGWDPNVPDSGVFLFFCKKCIKQMYADISGRGDYEAYNYDLHPSQKYISVPPGTVVLQIPNAGVCVAEWNISLGVWEYTVEPVFLYDEKPVRIDPRDLVEFRHHHD